MTSRAGASYLNDERKTTIAAPLRVMTNDVSVRARRSDCDGYPVIQRDAHHELYLAELRWDRTCTSHSDGR